MGGGRRKRLGRGAPGRLADEAGTAGPEPQDSPSTSPAHEEARKCFSVKAYTAAVAMVRRTLEGVCKDQNVQQGGRAKLFQMLEALKSAGKIDGRLFEWAQALRVLGNEGAHFTGVEVTREDASDSIDLAEALLDYLYVLSAQFDEFKARRGQAQSKDTVGAADESVKGEPAA
ncbi:DUF4145 domain-containing protein [Streptomyces ardesiacus]|uniref:DUF4145 domain-containing protein n=1 Tax=Streptomyces ardesiacus TaxID=285564 RepID=UPI0036A03B89